MTYTCLGNDMYEIKLIIYVDCDWTTNTTGITFDPDGILSIYNSNNELLQSILFTELDQIELPDESVGNDCLEIPTEFCVLRGIYTMQVELPPIPGGYQLAYQRCCRNPSINNIITPSDFGNTFTTNIPGSELSEDCNSSPSFNSYPPLALCLGDDINIDLSATDIDNDSLVYSFTTPLHGANNVGPLDITPPPFTEIVWAPGYSDQYPLDSNPPIGIDNSTGFITGTPSQIGMYIIGVKVDEYRDGILINSIVRDFRFLVTDCNVTTASIPLSNWYCNTLTVQFSNNSNNADTYFWDFGINNDSSTLYEPTYTYPDTGLYTVTLIANPNTVCADTNTVTFPLYTELLPFFENPEPQCIENNSFDLYGEGIAPQGTQITWEFGENATPSNSSVLNPNGISYSSPGSYTVSYNLQYNDCDETYIGTIEVFDEDIFPEIPDLDIQCFEENSFDFTAEGVYPDNANFLWNFGANSSPQTSTEQSPNNVQFSTSGIHNISLTIESNGCQNSALNSIEIYDALPIEIESSLPFGCEPFMVEFYSNLDPNNYTFYWDLGNGIDSTHTTQSVYYEGIYDVSLNVIENSSNCEGNLLYEDYISILPQPISAFTISPDTSQYGDPVFIINNAQHSSYYSYHFSSGHTTSEEEPEYIIPSIGDFTVWQYAMNEYDCIDSSSLNLHVNFNHTLWTPNVFSPNGDTQNELFYPIYTNVSEYELLIFDRWGKLIFSDLGKEPKWDGNHTNGLPCKIDSYIYLINYKTIDDNWHQAQGFVNLIR